MERQVGALAAGAVHPLAVVVGRPRTAAALRVGAGNGGTPRLGTAVRHAEVVAAAAAGVATVPTGP